MAPGGTRSLGRHRALSVAPDQPRAQLAEDDFASSAVPLFARRYDAVGFWGHLEDVSGDVWARIPSILKKADAGRSRPSTRRSAASTPRSSSTHGDRAPPTCARAANRGRRAVPDPDAGFSAPAHPIKPAGPDSPVSVKLAQYSTDQLHITVPAAPAGDIETVRIELGHAYGRFGVMDNYTSSEVDRLTFCGGPSGCKPTSAPRSGAVAAVR